MGSVLIIIGMHRSGTSATTGSLPCLGVELGHELHGAHPGINEKGYFEHGQLTDINRASVASSSPIFPRRPGNKANAELPTATLWAA